MTTVNDIHRMFNIIDADLRGFGFHMKGGEMKKDGEPTQPYQTYKNTLDSIFNYYADIFTTSERKQDSYRKSIQQLSKECDCEDYKCKNGSQPLEISEREREPSKIEFTQDENIRESQLLKKGEKLY